VIPVLQHLEILVTKNIDGINAQDRITNGQLFLRIGQEQADGKAARRIAGGLAEDLARCEQAK